MDLLKSLLHNVGVVIVGFAFALIATRIDFLLGIADFHSAVAQIAGCVLLITGFAIRVWATFLFYERHMAVIKLAPQKQLITSGPYRFSRNPLYLGGNVFIFLGAVLFLGSPAGIVLTAVNIVAVDFMIRREEGQLSQDFGEEWMSYRHRVRRWL
jgi:protein-S-isoprenylcysteine O-methyltransferase Ste14